jgi:hypothetical protein
MIVEMHGATGQIQGSEKGQKVQALPFDLQMS